MKFLSDELSRDEVEAENPGAIVERVEGGWLVFATQTDYAIWAAQA